VGAKILQQQHSSKSFQSLQKSFGVAQRQHRKSVFKVAQSYQRKGDIAPTSFSPLALCDKKKKSFEPRRPA